ncbi:corticotropin-releasing factor-binding protein-like isoform X2 [Denticeps clupeoides]|uniref:corticotropin-releasing factor-binding protein-like isoform X2 n=1 Tax=Denticeps clupeoides TaxID=299321 RepID=UPI0010A5619D|nr:corticotropin-releasing factor-binding protein-like isoform X2 [Denticeps clupeoides]
MKMNLMFRLLLLSVAARSVEVKLSLRRVGARGSPQDHRAAAGSPGPPRDHRRALGCVDALAAEGRFTFTADGPRLHCGVFFIGEPTEVISVEFRALDIDCSRGDFVKVFDGWVLNGEIFPSKLDHPLPLRERYVDYCASSMRDRVWSSQNVAMMFFRIHTAGRGFSITLRKMTVPFPCNIIAQSPEGRFTMVIPHQRRNCSFSIIYPVEIQILDFKLSQSHSNDAPLQRSRAGCSAASDFVQILGGSIIDTSEMFPMADVCNALNGQIQMKIGCDNIAVRMVSSGNYISAVSFRFRALHRHELHKFRENDVEDFCSSKQIKI